MFDGIKIECNYLGANWLNNDNMDFPLSVNTTTGEYHNTPRVHIDNGLKFKLTPSHNHPNITYASITGSIHKFHNSGLNNATDFTFSDVCTAIETLKKDYQIQPQNTPLRNLEIGINIELPIPVKEFMKMVVSMPTKRFSELKIEKVHLGKVCRLGDKEIRIYDKGKQTKQIDTNLLRIELKYKRMRELTTKHGIRTLADLTDFNKVKELHHLLLNTISNVIIFENNIQPNNISPSNQIKYWKYTSPYYWDKLDHKARYKQLRRYEQFLNNIAPQTIKNTILDLMIEKWEFLTENSTSNNPSFSSKKDKKAAYTKGTFATLEWRWQKSLLGKKMDIEMHTKILPEISKSNLHTNSKFCPSCGGDISHQRKDSIFCSEKYFTDAKKCRNKASGKTRTAKQLQDRKQEIIKLNELLYILPETNLSLTIFKKAKPIHQRKKQKTIKYIAYDELKQITKVRIRISNKPLEFTTLRAKELIKQIIKINYENEKSKNEYQ